MACLCRLSALAAILVAAGVSVVTASCSSSSAGAPAAATTDGGAEASNDALPDYRSGTRLRARLLTDFADAACVTKVVATAISRPRTARSRPSAPTTRAEEPPAR